MMLTLGIPLVNTIQSIAGRVMPWSLERCGQLSPLVVCQREDRYELIDGLNAWARRVHCPFGFLAMYAL